MAPFVCAGGLGGKSTLIMLLLLLDEPTSNLDGLSEAVILRSVRQAAGDRSVVLVSHRESTLRAADRRCRLEELMGERSGAGQAE